MTQAHMVFVAAVVLSIWATPSEAQEVKGWRGAEWGMTPDQVATALSSPLGERTRSPNKDEPDVFLFRIQKVPVGDWTATVTVVFRESGAQVKLFRVMLEWREDKNFLKLRDELKSTYCPPTSETRNASLGRTEARWILPLTQIDCSLFEVSDKAFTTVSFQEHKPAF